MGSNFQKYKGLREVDPLPPLLFNIVVEMLVILNKRAKDDGQISGVIPHLVDDGLFILQYADNTLIFSRVWLSASKENMKLLLTAFEKLSGLKIIFFTKVNYFALNRHKNVRDNILTFFVVVWGIFVSDILIFPCILESLVTMTEKQLNKELEKKLSSWKCKHIYVGGNWFWLIMCSRV